MHALAERDLAGLRVGGGRGRNRFFLRSDVEACAARVHGGGGGGGGEAAARKKTAAAEWKANSFQATRGGKTKKWKARQPGSHSARDEIWLSPWCWRAYRGVPLERFIEKPSSHSVSLSIFGFQ